VEGETGIPRPRSIRSCRRRYGPEAKRGIHLGKGEVCCSRSLFNPMPTQDIPPEIELAQALRNMEDILARSGLEVK
jgi:hypothetical protein